MFDHFPRVTVKTRHPVAVDSPDHLQPWGTKNDNSVWRPFNAKLWDLFGRPSGILDLGCSGGGMVRTFLEEGVLAVGIEGSDYSKLIRRAEWGTIPEFLFTADITKPFEVYLAETVPAKFSVVTMWEVIEHIAKADLAAVFDNIDRHLATFGHVIGSVSHAEEVIGGVVLHQTVEPWPWWESKFATLGWRNNRRYVEAFGHDLVRDQDESTPFVLSRL